jgi:threonine aldolase
MGLFASDNFSSVHPKVLKALEKVNSGFAAAYGDDPYTEAAKKILSEHFDTSAIHFVFTGTGGNVLGLQAVLKPYHSILCPKSAHIYTNECGAVERHTGCQILAIDCPHGKLYPEQLRPYIELHGDVHHTHPRVVSITQVTELGTCYTLSEIRAIADFAHENGMLLHMDGARLANAACFLSCSFRELTKEAGVDLLSFGGTKNGLLAGEAILFFERAKVDQFLYTQKQGMQLGSKMRYLAAQFMALFDEDLWKENALHANRLAKLLEEKLTSFPFIHIVHPVESNALFVQAPKEFLLALEKESYFVIWEPLQNIARWMTAWDTKESDIEDFIRLITKIASNLRL